MKTRINDVVCYDCRLGLFISSMTRVKGTVFTVPVIHGSIAHALGDDGTEARTHKWSVYIRPWLQSLLTHFIRHVEFVLHASFSPQTRRVTDMPYEVHEYGWGEFDIIIRVCFQDPSEKPIEIIHPLTLFHSDGSSLPQPVVTEFYDELVFHDPSEKLLNLLKSTPSGPHVNLKPSICAPYYTDFSNTENETLKTIQNARNRLREETLRKQERYEKLEEEREALVRELNHRGIHP